MPVVNWGWVLITSEAREAAVPRVLRRSATKLVVKKRPKWRRELSGRYTSRKRESRSIEDRGRYGGKKIQGSVTEQYLGHDRMCGAKRDVAPYLTRALRYQHSHNFRQPFSPPQTDLGRSDFKAVLGKNRHPDRDFDQVGIEQSQTREGPPRNRTLIQVGHLAEGGLGQKGGLHGQGRRKAGLEGIAKNDVTQQDFGVGGDPNRSCRYGLEQDKFRIVEPWDLLSLCESPSYQDNSLS